MTPHCLIVIGASAGGVETLKRLFSIIPSNLPAAIFVTIHLSPNHPSHLPEILSGCNGFVAKNPGDEEVIEPGVIYVAPPNRHMLIEDGTAVLATGPKENRHRPAINVLFRSAAYAHGPKVIGVLLTGALDDGTSGLWTIKRRGGIAIVQDPTEALHPQMPKNAIENVAVDYVVPVADIPALLTLLCKTEVPT